MGLTRTKRRSCGRKRRFPTEDDAVKFRARLVKRGAVRLAAYRCRHCEYWHVGHNPKPRRTRARRPR